MIFTLTEKLTSDWAAKTATGVTFPPYLPVSPGQSERLFAESSRREPYWVDFALPIPEEDMTSQITEIAFPEITEEFTPRTPLGKKLLALRNRAIQAGMTLLSADEVLEELRRRRGELEEDVANLR